MYVASKVCLCAWLSAGDASNAVGRCGRWSKTERRQGPRPSLSPFGFKPNIRHLQNIHHLVRASDDVWRKGYFYSIAEPGWCVLAPHAATPYVMSDLGPTRGKGSPKEFLHFHSDHIGLGSLDLMSRPRNRDQLRTRNTREEFGRQAIRHSSILSALHPRPKPVRTKTKSDSSLLTQITKTSILLLPIVS